MAALKRSCIWLALSASVLWGSVSLADEDAGAQVSAGPGQILGPRTGFYRNTVTMFELDWPGAPEGIGSAMKSLLTDPMVTEECRIGEAEYIDVSELTANGSNDGCAFENVETIGNSFSARATCSSEPSLSGILSIEGASTAEGFDVKVDAEFEIPDFAREGAGGSTMRSKVSIRSERVRDCTPQELKRARATRGRVQTIDLPG